MKKTIDIPSEQLSLGMYVAELDRPWIGTPFLFQGFRITQGEELEMLRLLCKQVRIDTTLGDPPSPTRLLPVAKPVFQSDASSQSGNQVFRVGARSPVANRMAFGDEMARAKPAYTALGQTLREAIDGLRAGGVLSLERIQASVDPIIESVGSNPDAAAWLTTIRRKDAGIYRHSMAVAILVLTYGRHLCLPKSVLRGIALGGLLFDVGKTRVQDSILMKPDRLTDAEFAEFQRHVAYGLEILEHCSGIDETVLEIVRSHHERHDGSGYPQGLKGDSIPAFGKIVGIADAYQTMLESPVTGRHLSPHEALSYLNSQRDRLFDSSLVEEFIQAIGIYPTGSFVKLSDGSVGVVYEQNRVRRLSPRVMIVIDGSGTRLDKFQEVDLLMSNSNSEDLRIVECLEPGAYGIDPDEIFL